MGRCDYHTIGYGINESEARQDAILKDQRDHGMDRYTGGISSSTHENDRSKCIVKPIPAKTCIVEKASANGPRKWETVFVISLRWGFGKENYDPHKSAIVKTNQGDAIKKAKEMALMYGEEFVINIEKQLVKGNSRIASICPKNSKLGKWEFTGTAKE